MTDCFSELCSSLGLGGMPDDDCSQTVLIRTPLARKKVLRSELSAEIWAAARTYLHNRNLPYSFVEFWALHCLRSFDDHFDELKQRCDTDEGVTVGDVTEAVKDFIREQLKDNADKLEREFIEAESLRNKSAFPLFRNSLRATRNIRAHMEDHFVILENVFHPICKKLFSLYIVFDGHNGSETALYAAKHMPHFLLSTEHPFNSFAIREAFIHTQSLLTERFNMHQALSGGTTVVLALLCDDMVHIAWLGDSTAYALSNRQVFFKTSPHKPNRKDEYERIRRQGGCVTKASVFRINGISAVSRSLGDMALKPYVSHEPQLESFPSNRFDCLLLASDGFSDFCSDAELIEAVYDDDPDDPDDPDHGDDASSTCIQLIDRARKRNSDDNITVMLIYARWPPSGGGHATSTRTPRSIPVHTTKKTDEFIVDMTRPLSAVVNLRRSTVSPTGNSGRPALRAHGGARPYSSLV